MPISAYLKAGLFVVAAAVALFAVAGTFAIPSFWVYLAIFADDVPRWLLANTERMQFSVCVYGTMTF